MPLVVKLIPLLDQLAFLSASLCRLPARHSNSNLAYNGDETLSVDTNDICLGAMVAGTGRSSCKRQTEWGDLNKSFYL